MGDLHITNRQRRQLQRHAQNRLHTVVQTAIIPYFQERVRVDTGRLQASIRADYPNVSISEDAVETTVLFGGTDEYGVYSEREQLETVDYVESLYDDDGSPARGELQAISNNLPDEIDYII